MFIETIDSLGSAIQVSSRRCLPSLNTLQNRVKSNRIKWIYDKISTTIEEPNKENGMLSNDPFELISDTSLQMIQRPFQYYHSKSAFQGKSWRGSLFEKMMSCNGTKLCFLHECVFAAKHIHPQRDKFVYEHSKVMPKVLWKTKYYFTDFIRCEILPFIIMDSMFSTQLYKLGCLSNLL